MNRAVFENISLQTNADKSSLSPALIIDCMANLHAFFAINMCQSRWRLMLPASNHRHHQSVDPDFYFPNCFFFSDMDKPEK